MIGKSISVVLTVLLGALPILAYFINLQIKSGNPVDKTASPYFHRKRYRKIRTPVIEPSD